jgi:2-methylcitrate dehydratase
MCIGSGCRPPAARRLPEAAKSDKRRERMLHHQVAVHASREPLPRQGELAWKLAAVAADPVPVADDVAAMIANRLIDDWAVALAAINRHPVVSARDMALAHPRRGGASLLGMTAGRCVSPEWAAWANGTAVRELDMHDTFLAADYAHPGDTIPPILAVAQACGRSGADLLRGIAAAYEVHIDLVRGICLHENRVDHIAHLCPAQAAGIGALLGLDVATIYQAVQQAVHVAVTTRQARKGEISSWKAFAPAHAGKLAVEAVDRAMRGETSPSPIYEGEDALLAWMLAPRTARDRGLPAPIYEVPLPEPGEPKRAIMDSFTKEHSAEYQAQAFIDLAFLLRRRIADTRSIARVVLHTSRHTHSVIGTGSGDPQKFDPGASRETLDHSLMYIFAVALQDGCWHHQRSYEPRRAARPDTVALWRSIETREDPEWTRRYHAADPRERAFGGRAEVWFKDGSRIEAELAVANAHPAGATPFGRADYVRKFQSLTADILTPAQTARFLETVEDLPRLRAGTLRRLNVAVAAAALRAGGAGIF